ncbi:methyltransferase domain-containing protein [Jejuia pallidilutea]|uniref:SAM-dependent methyltransferases n=1 Tax=Jejuia pallidilutea TaxID=504487 RepID=A0A090VZF9_9FLAO|nr:methyltransferase domain-containing protein [Jejuia pallidilutea]GAL65471.1 SAM-dependent methyltransferases [Jejuia pallidilutea]GAL70026.1 SAM-dependent methyltransferases [Jejuia pallidilutea]GAL88977.1 SAM-dependent methyltransferases [Jejuia pallidilutea]
MALFVDTSYRSNATEIMDDFSMKGTLLRDTLDKLGSINKWLGGNTITLNGIKQLLHNQPKAKTYTIVDLGCGHGDILRLVAEYGRKHQFSFNLVGIDANQDAIDYANELSVNYPEITFQNIDIFSEAFLNLEFDIVLSTLFLHHFKDGEIVNLLQHLSHKAKLGIVINDLHRSKLAYGLFKLLGLLISNHMIVQDGLTSILRAFKREDLEKLSETLNLTSKIYWKWAFRYQWLIFNTK